MPPTHSPWRLRAPILSRIRSPSNAASATGAVPYSKIELGGRLALSGKVEMNLLGEAVHRFLAADRGPSEAGESRRNLAGRILIRWAISTLSVDELVVASDRLHGYIRDTWPNSTVLREVPLTGGAVCNVCLGE
jgi:ATP-dependent helicase/nuclease subunit A